MGIFSRGIPLTTSNASSTYLEITAIARF